MLNNTVHFYSLKTYCQESGSTFKKELRFPFYITRSTSKFKLKQLEHKE